MDELAQRARSLEECVEAERAAHLESKFNSEIIQVSGYIRLLNGLFFPHLNVACVLKFLGVIDISCKGEGVYSTAEHEASECSLSQLISSKVSILSYVEEETTAFS